MSSPDKEEVDRIIEEISKVKGYEDKDELRYIIQSFVEQGIYEYSNDEKGRLCLKIGKNFDKRNELSRPKTVAGKTIKWVN